MYSCSESHHNLNEPFSNCGTEKKTIHTCCVYLRFFINMPRCDIRWNNWNPVVDGDEWSERGNATHVIGRNRDGELGRLFRSIQFDDSVDVKRRRLPRNSHPSDLRRSCKAKNGIIQSVKMFWILLKILGFAVFCSTGLQTVQWSVSKGFEQRFHGRPTISQSLSQGNESQVAPKRIGA